MIKNFYPLLIWLLGLLALLVFDPSAKPPAVWLFGAAFWLVVACYCNSKK